jgi:hypothetical protein
MVPRIGKILASVAIDAIALMGAGLVSWGAYEIWSPLGLIVPGLFLLVFAALLSRWRGE